jgi:multicomponent Na+:H+ antiporter subunit E
LVVFLTLYAFWLIFSGHYDALHLGLGILCSAVVAAVSHDLLILNIGSPHMLVKLWRFIQYVPWLLYQVLLANLHVVSLVIDPRKIRPQVVRFKTELTSDVALVTLGNSITLTPGTVTMDIADGEFVVHAVSDKVARDLLTGEMEQRIAHVFVDPDRTEGASRSS